MILSWWMSCGVGWTYPPESRTLAHSTFISFIMFGIVVLKHWLFWGTQIATHIAHPGMPLACVFQLFSSSLYGPFWAAESFFPRQDSDGSHADLPQISERSHSSSVSSIPVLSTPMMDMEGWLTAAGMGTKHQGLFWAPRFAFCSNDATEKWILRRWNHIGKLVFCWRPFSRKSG